MTWKSQLRRASFRGVQFHVRDRTFKTGRSIKVHEFPKRDSPFPEDMGKDTRKWTVDAYLIGDDYMGRRDRLVAACERKGPGSYIDHWGRSGLVVCEGCELKEASEEGRVARFQLSFIEAGGGAAPVSIVATAAGLAGAATGLASAAISQAARLGVVAQTQASLSVALKLPVSGLPVALSARVSGSVLGR